MRKKFVLSGRKKIRQKKSKPGAVHSAAAEAFPLPQQEEAQKAEAQRKEARNAEAQREEPQQEEPYLTETVVFGGYDSTVCFVDESRGIRKKLVDSEGRIQHFPGIVREDHWVKEVSPNALKPRICFRTSFERRADGWIMLWQIQPDGRYWADDDGFGMENDYEVTLYTYVNMNGNFTEPFRIYQVGDQEFTLDRYETALTLRYPKYLAELKEGTLDTSGVYQNPLDLLFPYIFQPRPYGGRRAYYNLQDREEAASYINHPVLFQNLLEASQILSETDKSRCERMGLSGNRRIRSSMTLFWLLTGEPVFRDVLDRLFDGQTDENTAKLLQTLTRFSQQRA